MLYHVSPTAGLKLLEPRPSTHGKAYVYALPDRTAALLFGARHDDFDFLIDEEAGVPAVWECWPGAFEAVFRGKRCSVYAVQVEGFVQGATGWDPEWVCPRSVAVQSEEPVADLAAALEAGIAAGQLILYRFSEEPAYKKLIAGHITDRLIRFDRVDAAGEDPRFQTHFACLLAALREVLSGSYL